MLPWETPRFGWRQGTSGATSSTGTLKFWKESSVGSGSYTEVSLDTANYCQFKIVYDTSHPTVCEFDVRTAQHNVPFARLLHIVFTHQDFGGMDTPLFEGFIQDWEPVESNKVHIVAMDATKRTADEVPVMSGAWTAGSPPVPTSSDIPRLVLNCKIGQDDDAAFSRAQDADVETILGYLMDDPLLYLRAIYAAPLTTNPYQSTAYVATEIDGLDFKPQDKLLFENIRMRAAMQAMLDIYPAKRVWFEPGRVRRYWHFYDMLTAPSYTLTLGKYTTGTIPVLSLDLNSSIENRFSALTIYGPKTRVTEVATVNGGGLTELWSGAEETAALNYLGVPPHPTVDPAVYGDAFQAWQITDTSKRRISEVLPAEYDVQMAAFMGTDLAWMRTRIAVLQVKWESGGDWQPVADRYFELDQGIVRIRHRLLKATQTGATSYTYAAPFDVRLVYAYYSTPLSVRYPSSGYSGTLYSVAGISRDERIYDEALAVGYENGTPVASATRTAQYDKLAENYQKAHRDIAWSGQCVLRGIHYEFARLNKRINFTALDGDGASLTTGWEAINAPLTGCELDFTNRLTTLIFNGDLLEYMQKDLDAVKSKLKVDQDIYRNEWSLGARVVVNGVAFGYTATSGRAETIGAAYEEASQSGNWSGVNDIKNNLTYNDQTMTYEDRRMMEQG